LKALNFSYNTKLVSEKAFADHVKLYQQYVDSFNELKSQSYNLNAVIIHEIYFKNIGPGDEKPGEKFLKCIGDYEKWRRDFCDTALAARGWCACVYDQCTDDVMNVLHDGYSAAIVNAYPLIVLDMEEHSYYADYLSDKKTYIDNFIQCLRWDIIEKRTGRLYGGEQ